MKLFLLAVLPAFAFASPMMGGGVSDTTLTPDSEPVVFALQESNKFLMAADNGFGVQQVLGLQEIVHATQQVVAGYKYTMKIRLDEGYVCDVHVWLRGWLQGAERIQTVDNTPTCVKQQARALGGGVMVGGIGPQKDYTENVGKDGILANALSLAACSVNSRMNSMFQYTLGATSGVKYTTQVTSGTTYRFLQVPVQQTSCQEMSTAECMQPDNLQSCQANGNTQTCDFTVQSQPWMTPALTVTDVSCR